MSDQQPSTIGKAIAAAGGGAGGGALMQIIAWVLSLKGIDMPATIQMAGASVLSTVLAVIAAHFTPLGPPNVPPSN